MWSCTAPDCENDLRKKKFFAFPADLERRRLWTMRCNLTEVGSSAKICEDHFERSQFLLGQDVKKLKPDAVPTLFFSRERKIPESVKKIVPAKKPPIIRKEPTSHSKGISDTFPSLFSNPVKLDKSKSQTTSYKDSEIIVPLKKKDERKVKSPTNSSAIKGKQDEKSIRRSPDDNNRAFKHSKKNQLLAKKAISGKSFNPSHENSQNSLCSTGSVPSSVRKNLAQEAEKLTPSLVSDLKEKSALENKNREKKNHWHQLWDQKIEPEGFDKANKSKSVKNPVESTLPVKSNSKSVGKSQMISSLNSLLGMGTTAPCDPVFVDNSHFVDQLISDMIKKVYLNLGETIEENSAITHPEYPLASSRDPRLSRKHIGSSAPLGGWSMEGLKQLPQASNAALNISEKYSDKKEGNLQSSLISKIGQPHKIGFKPGNDQSQMITDSSSQLREPVNVNVTDDVRFKESLQKLSNNSVPQDISSKQTSSQNSGIETAMSSTVKGVSEVANQNLRIEDPALGKSCSEPVIPLSKAVSDKNSIFQKAWWKEWYIKNGGKKQEKSKSQLPLNRVTPAKSDQVPLKELSESVQSMKACYVSLMDLLDQPKNSSLVEKSLAGIKELGTKNCSIKADYPKTDCRKIENMVIKASGNCSKTPVEDQYLRKTATVLKGNLSHTKLMPESKDLVRSAASSSSCRKIPSCGKSLKKGTNKDPDNGASDLIIRRKALVDKQQKRKMPLSPSNFKKKPPSSYLRRKCIPRLKKFTNIHNQTFEVLDDSLSHSESSTLRPRASRRSKGQRPPKTARKCSLNVDYSGCDHLLSDPNDSSFVQSGCSTKVKRRCTVVNASPTIKVKEPFMNGPQRVKRKLTEADHEIAFKKSNRLRGNEVAEVKASRENSDELWGTEDDVLIDVVTPSDDHLEMLSSKSRISFSEFATRIQQSQDAVDSFADEDLVQLVPQIKRWNVLLMTELRNFRECFKAQNRKYELLFESDRQKEMENRRLRTENAKLNKHVTDKEKEISDYKCMVTDLQLKVSALSRPCRVHLERLILPHHMLQPPQRLDGMLESCHLSEPSSSKPLSDESRLEKKKQFKEKQVEFQSKLLKMLKIKNENKKIDLLIKEFEKEKENEQLRKRIRDLEAQNKIMLEENEAMLEEIEQYISEKKKSLLTPPTSASQKSRNPGKKIQQFTIQKISIQQINSTNKNVG